MQEPIESKHLGKQVSYPKKYSPELLVAVPRYLNRELYEIKDEYLPFLGIDVWHAYEVSFLTDNGLPVVGLLKITYPCDNPVLVESKSLKLYLNSYNMEKLGTSLEEASARFLQTVQTDLEVLLETKVNVALIKEGSITGFDFDLYELLEDQAEIEALRFTDVKENPALLQEDSITGSLKVASHLLRSNCKITHQPDWGSVYIHMEGNQLPEKTALLQYIVSFRDEYHFHEEVCEMMYKRLWDHFHPEKLMVSCIYTRRGGIDICPVRASHAELFPEHLVNVEVLSDKLLRQ